MPIDLARGKYDEPILHRVKLRIQSLALLAVFRYCGLGKYREGLPFFAVFRLGAGATFWMICMWIFSMSSKCVKYFRCKNMRYLGQMAVFLVEPMKLFAYGLEKKKMKVLPTVLAGRIAGY